MRAASSSVVEVWLVFMYELLGLAHEGTVRPKIKFVLDEPGQVGSSTLDSFYSSVGLRVSEGGVGWTHERFESSADGLKNPQQAELSKIVGIRFFPRHQAKRAQGRI